MALHWAKLRSWNGSQHHAFEELCSQLAASESTPPDARFFRKGTPDAGIECFWQLANGDEWAWQAKFFLSSPLQSQWQQINDSVATALAKHPRLRKYIVCLPYDLPDERREGRISALEKWRECVLKWEKAASKKKMSVTFEYWGQSEIGRRLSSEDHRGRHWFWFNEEYFGNAWFKSRMNEAVENARDRYSPELNIDLPIRSYFDALGRTPQFFSKIRKLYSDTRLMFSRLRLGTNAVPYVQHYNNISTVFQELIGTIKPWVTVKLAHEYSVTQAIPWQDIGCLALQLTAQLDNCISAMLGDRERSKSDKSKVSQSSHDELDTRIYYLREFKNTVTMLLNYSSSDECKLSNQAALLLLGTAGQGKTHLLCDVAKHDTDSSRPRIMLHGEHFQNAEPWSQIIRLLGLNCSLDEFVGALEAAGQANNSRLLIFIDALNEGEGNRLWSKFLPGMLARIRMSPWLGICISVRSSYEQYIVPQALNETRITRIRHTGFGDFNFVATAKFFNYFGIEPSNPLMLPEFDNPLFLKLFCQSLQNMGLTRVPSGLHGITAVFKLFIESVDNKLSRHELLDYDPRTRVVSRAIEQLTQEMANRKTDRLPLVDAKAILNSVLPREGHEKSLLRHLESESLVTVIPDYRHNSSEMNESVRFTYQRFSDHLITQYLLNQHLNKLNPKESFSKRRALGKLLKDEQACCMNRGILEAMAIQVPELTKKELPELAVHLSNIHPMREAFVDSLMWRNPQSIGSGALRYVNEQVLVYRGSTDKFWNALITLSTIPNHPFNADRLHNHLSRYEMAERDSWWSIFLHHHSAEEGPIVRLIRWAWSENDKSPFTDEVIRLAGMTLAWFFTTPNRFLRDRATKAMVKLCEGRLDVLRQIMKSFVGVSDPYVSERLYAVACGCALRSTDAAALGRLAQDVYEWIFKSGEPPPHILLRDYARGVVEMALYRRARIEVDISLVRPPYRSEWPAISVPDNEELKSWEEWSNHIDLAKVHLYRSVMKDEDFSRYIIGDLSHWTNQRLDSPKVPTHKEVHDGFVASLTKRQRLAWDQFINARRAVEFYRKMDPEKRAEEFKREFTDDELEGLVSSAERACVRMLGRNSVKHTMFIDAIAYEAKPNKYYHEDRFDSGLARRWMMQRIINMGWTLKQFGEFDSSINRHGDHNRTAHKPERMGKKYQWIAYHELLARLSDNFLMHVDKWSPNTGQYNGPWDEPFRRDIDPSNLLCTTQCDKGHEYSGAWWFPVEFSAWDEPIAELDWLKKKDNLPSIEQQIVVHDPHDGSEWLTVQANYNWEQPVPTGEDRYNFKRRDMWYILNGYLLKKADASRLINWARKQDWMGRWMPESQTTSSLHLGEFFWSPAFKAQDCVYYGRQGWTKKTERGSKVIIPTELLVANDEYSHESGGYDCSIEETFLINLPCRFLVESMKLQWRGVEGHWFNEQGTLIAFDPSVRFKGPSVLLFRRDAIVDFLKRAGLALFWTVLGEKRVIGGMLSDRSFKGCLEINGAYLLNGNEVKGSSFASFKSPIRRNKR